MTGREGQLARSLKERARGHSGIELEFVGRPEADLAVAGATAIAIESARPDMVINAAAYTAVDQAEQEPERAFRINADAAGEIAAAARAVGAPIIQLSSDYVFDGRSSEPYGEDAPTNPLGAYGRAKLAGEEQVRAGNPDHLIVRTSWVYSPFGRNFVKTMLSLGAARDEVRVVADQIGCPTSALDLADALLLVTERRHGGAAIGGTYHLAGRCACSWAELATEIFRVSAGLGGPSARVVPIATSDYPTAAARPANSVLDSGRFERDFACAMPPWRDSLAVVVRRLVEE